MARRALILGAGQIGCAVASRLAAAGWRTALLSRSPPLAPLPAELGIEQVQVDRNDDAALHAAVADGADFLLDTIAYTTDHARQLARLSGSTGALCLISTASVYADAQGRGIEDAVARGFPEFPDPMTEDQRTVEPGPQTYSSRKRAAELLLLQHSSCPLSILRPAAIYGTGSRQPREWWFVKRLLDGRTRVPLLYGGASRFHTSGVKNIASLAWTVAERRASGIFHAVDPEAPTVTQIGRAVMSAMGKQADLVPIEAAPDLPHVGRSPWAVPSPLVFSDAAARSLGYVPAASYSDGVRPVVEWLSGFEGDWHSAFPTLAGYPWDLFDYAAEDEVLSRAG